MYAFGQGVPVPMNLEAWGRRTLRHDERLINSVSRVSPGAGSASSLVSLGGYDNMGRLAYDWKGKRSMAGHELRTHWQSPVSTQTLWTPQALEHAGRPSFAHCVGRALSLRRGSRSASRDSELRSRLTFRRALRSRSHSALADDARKGRRKEVF